MHLLIIRIFIFSSVQLLSCVWLFATAWTRVRQGSLSITNSQSLLKLIESVMPSNHLIHCHSLLLLQSFPGSGSFHMSQFFASGGQSTRVSAWGSVLPMNIQDWFPLWLTGWISLQSKGLSRVFSNTTFQKHQFFLYSAFFIVQLSHPNTTTRKTIALTRQTFASKVMSLGCHSFSSKD